ncbi:MAG: methyltransferase, TrmH family [Frankiaceae bacterium]|jgi:TrmH family RNA methyltransferase|nr:methyltransferase, TrmH family [Frankiaceae bacterium]
MTSGLSAARVRSLKQLARRGVRHERRLFLAEGVQAVREALAEPDGVVDLYIAAGSSERTGDVEALAVAAGVRVSVVDERQLADASDTVTPQGVVAVCRFRDVTLADVVRRTPRLICVLASIRDPGNAGTVLRAADAAGADAVVFADDAVDPYNSKAVRASAGSLFHVPFVVGVTAEDSVRALRDAGVTVMATDAQSGTDLFALADSGGLAGPTAWLFGNEAWGLPPQLRGLADTVVGIPIYGRAESLNLATAATICLYTSARSHHR